MRLGKHAMIRIYRPPSHGMGPGIGDFETARPNREVNPALDLPVERNATREYSMIARRLNTRPRKTLEFDTPAGRLRVAAIG